ncbi:hypothetical protein ASPACDRAFT_25290 [Aspergillus aculeatus ATCC 16872]|uniref:Zn(2)-C6 fungal-type domain-containing protein n=1 Tax=Aspergillus aculeatus (strain ATCC 16872 / CBS 172.66 / WB 5094) TaxID=690307 RepID=A0A1L9X062_ASPA1|nr:uncharacterized protein ASPACDRAFT_25290 [Aspergillus aculeatus ATCC 16872]OJK01902.1 hypothetical protein ASPACDRAFT_25290 [Aspergillus aculeatus ATCC 16872]
MPPNGTTTTRTRSSKIIRKHSGCKSCRRRGKKCDETKPHCRACVRLSLECSYGVNLTFRHTDQATFQRHTQAIVASSAAADPVAASRQARTESDPSAKPLLLCDLTVAGLSPSLDLGDGLEVRYLSHFQDHVRHLLPALSMTSVGDIFDAPYLRAAALCISASSLSMLNAPVQSRHLVDDHQTPVFSPLVNSRHHRQARNYHDRALQLCRTASAGEVARNAALILRTLVLLAYYHHASTNHLNFRLAVWDTLRFIAQCREQIMHSPDAVGALQMWHRLCVSHRLSKPPSLLLEGEGVSSFGPNCFPDPTDHLYLSCVLGMSTDELIYDILIKSMEIRSRLIVFRSVASTHRIQESSRDIGRVAHRVLNTMLGRCSPPDEYDEAQEGFVRGSHLRGLLMVQKERLEVWRSRVSESLPCCNAAVGTAIEGLSGREPFTPHKSVYPSHREAMNAIYSLLCEMMFEESNGTCTSDASPIDLTSATPNQLDDLAHRACQLISTLDFTTSSTADVYTFSLAECLLQLAFLWRSDTLFDYILGIVWPELERKTRGFEHSHYPTHLAKRIILHISRYWSQGRAVTLVLPAVPEDIPKPKLLDINQPIDVVVCGHDADGTAWMERIPLP